MGAFLKIILYAVLIFYAFNMLIKLIFRRKMRKLEKKKPRPTPTRKRSLTSIQTLENTPITKR